MAASLCIDGKARLADSTGPRQSPQSVPIKGQILVLPGSSSAECGLLGNREALEKALCFAAAQQPPVPASVICWAWQSSPAGVAGHLRRTTSQSCRKHAKLSVADWVGRRVVDGGRSAGCSVCGKSKTTSSDLCDDFRLVDAAPTHEVLCVSRRGHGKDWSASSGATSRRLPAHLCIVRLARSPLLSRRIFRLLRRCCLADGERANALRAGRTVSSCLTRLRESG